MGGPGCSVMLRAVPAGEDRAAAEDILGCGLSDSSRDVVRAGCTFGVRLVVEDRALEPLGYTSPAHISLYAVSRSSEHHVGLARLAAELAERLDCYVDLDGAIVPPLERLFEMSWSEAAPHAERMLAGIPGHVVAIPYQTAWARTWATHVVDAAFLWAWIGHPSFYMIT